MGLTGFPVIKQVSDAIRDHLRETAARLGSPVRLYTDGIVIYADSFEYPLNDRWFGVGNVSVRANTSNTGASSLFMQTGALAGDMAIVDRFVPYMGLSRYGIKHSIQLSGLNFDRTFTTLMIFLIEDRTTITTGWRYSLPSGTISVRTDTVTGYTPISSGILPRRFDVFIPTKLVVDLNSRRYVSLTIQDHILDISNYEPLVAVSAGLVVAGSVDISLAANNLVAQLASFYVDDVVFSYQEP